MLRERAPAKVNLTLRVLGRRSDGFHELSSLVAFADEADELVLELGEGAALAVSGPFADGAGDQRDNLVLTAAGALAAKVPGLRAGRFHLTKNLPVAAGLGGGSADAAAALRLLAALNRLPGDDPRLYEAAAAIGSDVPVCLACQARMMSGRGEILGAPLALPPLEAVLVNPGVPVSTAAVFGRLELGGQTPTPSAPPSEASAFLNWLAGEPNDLEAPATELAPAITNALAALRGLPGCRLARMSGSGATVFGLFASSAEAEAGARRLAAAHPAWWVRPTTLR